MRRLWRIFLLHFQDAFESRSRSFVWFLLAVLNPLISLIFLQGVLRTGLVYFGEWNSSTIALYYFLLIIANALIISHIEEKIAEYDIHEGRLAMFLLKPFSYLWLNFFEELPHRLIQGSFGLAIFLCMFLIFPHFFNLSMTFSEIMTALIIVCLAYMISFLLKVIVGLSAFWFTDYHGLQQVVGVAWIILAGVVMPVGLYPQFLIKITHFLPFVYIIYYPVLSWMGRLHQLQMLRIILFQLIWISILYFIYQQLWTRGKKIFSGVGF